MKHKKLIQFLFGIVFIIFLCSYFVERSGYYEYHLGNQKRMTDEAISQFEQDVKNGKEIDLNDYLEDTKIDYSSRLTRTTTDVSIKLNQYLKRFFGGAFDVLEKFVR